MWVVICFSSLSCSSAEMQQCNVHVYDGQHGDENEELKVSHVFLRVWP